MAYQVLTHREISQCMAKLAPGWTLDDSNHHISRKFTFRNFSEALSFTNRVGEIAEKLNHHPELLLTWGKVELKIWTHSIDGLTKQDFILAAKIDERLV